MTDSELIAQFLASKTVKRVAAGIRTIDETRMYHMAHGTDSQREAAMINERHVVTGQHVRNGLGEWIA